MSHFSPAKNSQSSCLTQYLTFSNPIYVKRFGINACEMCHFYVVDFCFRRMMKLKRSACFGVLKNKQGRFYERLN